MLIIRIVIFVAAAAHGAACSCSCLHNGCVLRFLRDLVRMTHPPPPPPPPHIVVSLLYHKSRSTRIEVLGGGNINDTYLVRSSSTDTLVLQRINSSVFPDVSIRVSPSTPVGAAHVPAPP